MIFKIPWIISRRRKFLAITLDYLLTFYLYNFLFNIQFNSFPRILVSSGFSFFWVVSSYVLGRYLKIKDINFINFIKAVIKIVFLFILCNIIYLLINWGYPLLFFWSSDNFYNADYRKLSNFFIRSSLYISTTSAIVQYLFSLITQKIYSRRKEWFFYGSKSKFEDILMELNLNNKKINLTRIPNNQDLNIKTFENIEGMIIENIENINQNNIDIIFKLKLKGFIIETVFTWFENLHHRIPTHIIENKYQLIEKLKSTEDNYQVRIKRIADILVSAFLLLLTFPLTLLISIFIFLEDGGPIFYFQTRTGLKGKRIKIVKFRSMKIDAEKNGIQWSKTSDPRITKIGHLIRITRLDELPQLYCVIIGEMSLIGPRPERPEIEKEFLNEIPYYNCRNILKPGISGWAQVNYPYGASIKDTSKKLSFDIYYIIHYSVLLDLLILFKTMKLVLNAKGSKPIFIKDDINII